MTEESKRASWVWIAFREFLYIAGIFLLIFFIWFFDQEEKPIWEIIKNIQNLRFPQDYYIFAIVTGAFYLWRLASIAKRWRYKAKILPGSRGVPDGIKIGKFEIKIENDLMLFKKKGFLKRRRWKERKSEFRGVRLWGEHVQGEEVNYFKYIIQLLYMKQSKTIILCKEEITSIKEFITIRKSWKETARVLGLPTVEPYPLGSLWRRIQDLDKPIRALAKKNRSSFNFKIDSHLPSRTKLLQKDEELTIIYRNDLRQNIKIIISPKLMKIGRIIIPFDEMQYIGPLIHTLVVASDSEVFDMNELSYDQKFWLGRLILAGACGKPNILRIKYESTTE
jgi:hypothetical protein